MIKFFENGHGNPNSNFDKACELNYNDQKIRRTPTHDIREHWTAVSTLLGLISSVYRNIQPATTDRSAESLHLSQ